MQVNHSQIALEDSPAIIPNQILRDTKLTPNEKIFIVLLANMLEGNNGDPIDISFAKLAIKMGCTRKGVFMVVQSLKNKGIIEKVCTKYTFFEKCPYKRLYKRTIVRLYNLLLVYSNKHISNSISINNSISKNISNSNNYKQSDSKPISATRTKAFSKRVVAQPSSNSDCLSPKHKNLLLEKLMLLPYITKHRLDTQAYKLSSDALRKLSSGKFFLVGEKPVVKMHKEWMFIHGISLPDLRRSWSEQDILYGFTEVSNMLSPNYWPNYKKNIPHDVCHLIYNPISCISHFVKLYRNKAILLGSKFKEKESEVKSVRSDRMDVYTYEKLQKAVEECFDSVLCYTMTPNELKHLRKAAIKMMDLWDEKIHKVGADYHQASNYIKDYCEWIVDQHAGQLEKVWQLGPDTKDWNNFIRSRGLNE